MTTANTTKGDLTRARLVLRDVRELEADLNRDLAARFHRDDHIKMRRYNDLGGAALRCFPGDAVIGELPTMPNEELRPPWYQPGVDASIPSRLLLGHVVRLRNRLEELVGDDPGGGTAANDMIAGRATQGTAVQDEHEARRDEVLKALLLRAA